MLTDDQKNELTGLALECLNSAFEADPVAMQCLIANRVPCTPGLADHPHVVVHSPPTIKSQPNGNAPAVVGMLGVICGLFSAMGLPQVGAKFSEPDAEGRSKLEGFCDYKW